MNSVLRLIAVVCMRENVHGPGAYSPWAGFLSFLVPGLVQIYQGRVAKCLLFLVCLCALCFCGMALGRWNDALLPEAAPRRRHDTPWALPFPGTALTHRQ